MKNITTKDLQGKDFYEGCEILGGLTVDDFEFNSFGELNFSHDVVNGGIEDGDITTVVFTSNMTEEEYEENEDISMNEILEAGGQWEVH